MTTTVLRCRPASTKATISVNKYFEGLLEDGVWYIRNKFLKDVWNGAHAEAARVCDDILNGRVLPTDNPRIINADQVCEDIVARRTPPSDRPSVMI